jgi:hypothetical protein
MTTVQSLDKWHKTRQGHLVFGLVELVVAYGFASWAIDTGSLWQYALAIILAFGGIRNLVYIFFHPNK